MRLLTSSVAAAVRGVGIGACVVHTLVLVVMVGAGTRLNAGPAGSADVPEPGARGSLLAQPWRPAIATTTKAGRIRNAGERRLTALRIRFLAESGLEWCHWFPTEAGASGN